MKKCLATILAFIYLSTSMGATIHFHYCMGKLVSWGLADNPNYKNCSFCGMPKNSNQSNFIQTGCCKDEHKQIAVDKDQKTTGFSFQFLNPGPALPAITTVSLPGAYVHSLAVEYPATNAPPNNSQPPVFLLNRNFRI